MKDSVVIQAPGFNFDALETFDMCAILEEEIQKKKQESSKTYRINYMIGESYHHSTIKTNNYENVTNMINRCFTGMSDCKVLGIEEIK